MENWNPDIDVMLTDSEDEEENDFKRDFKGREAMLFVIDANLYANEKLFQEALKMIHSAFITGLLINDNDLIGIIFANTEFSPLPYEESSVDDIVIPEKCAVFLPPRQLTTAIVEHYQRFMSTAVENFSSKYGISSGVGGSFAKMLRLSMNLFNKCGYSLKQSSIVYITDKETPHLPNTNEYQYALQKAIDLEGGEVEFYVIPMIDDFNYDKFYKEFTCLVRDIDMESFQAPDAEQLRILLTDRKLKQDFHNRCLGHFKFSLGADLQISAQYFNYFHRQRYPRKVELLKKTNDVVTTKSEIYVGKVDGSNESMDNFRMAHKKDGLYELCLGDEPVRMTQDQLIRIRNLHAPGMMLLGFKDRDDLPENFYYLSDNFMYPDDKSISGSKRLFAALWERCMARDKIAICLFMRKKKSIPRYIALVPMEEQRDDSKQSSTLVSHDGFKIVYLPMAKHIRNVNLIDWNSIENTATDDDVDLMTKIVKKLRIKYAPNNINDPTLESIQSNLLALALNVTSDDNGSTDIAKSEMKDERISSLLPEIENIFGKDDVVAKKRPAKSVNGEHLAAKIPKLTEDQLQSYDYVQKMIENKSLNSCTVVQLRYILNLHYDVKLPKNATKQILIDRIHEADN